MEVKGTAVVVIDKFVKDSFGDEALEKWLSSLPPASKQVFERKVLASSWYDLRDALIVPTEKVYELFYHGDIKGVWELGRYSADVALRGIYKIFAKIATPDIVVQKASNVLQNYYKPITTELVEHEAKNFSIKIVGITEDTKVMDYRVAGWAERAFQICGTPDIKISITQHAAQADGVTLINAKW